MIAITLGDLKSNVFRLQENEFGDIDISKIKEENKAWLMLLTEDRIEELDNN
jgi:hypothetical protein